MQTGRRSSSSHKAALLVLAGVLAVAGCTGGVGMLSGNGRAEALRLVTFDTPPEITASTSKIPASDKVVETIQISPTTSVENPEPQDSAWCKYLREDSAAEAAILRSPTLSGNVDDSGKAAASLGVSVSSFAKARLVEKAAQVRCRRHLAETGLQKLAFIAPQGLTAAGFRAKATSIRSRKAGLDELRKQVKTELSRGNITAEKATSLSVLIDQINAEGSAALSQADRRLADEIGKPTGAAVLGEDLLKAEAELQDIDNQIRTADAVDLSLSAGWNDNGLRDGFDIHDDSFSGKISFSIKLGAVSPQRFAHERLAREAKLRAIRDQEGGTLWQIQVLYRAHERALVGLMESQSQLDAALGEAIKLVTALTSVPTPEFAGTLIAAKIQVVRLLADKAAIDGSIDEIKQNLKRLSTG